MMVIRELSVLLKVLCSSSRAVIIFSIWARLSGLVGSGLALSRPALSPAAIVPAAALSALPALVLRRQCFRYWLGFGGEDFSGMTDA